MGLLFFMIFCNVFIGLLLVLVLLRRRERNDFNGDARTSNDLRLGKGVMGKGRSPLFAYGSANLTVEVLLRV